MFNGTSWFNFVPAGVSDLVKSTGIACGQKSPPTRKALRKRGLLSKTDHGFS